MKARRITTLVFCFSLAGFGFWLGESGLPIWAVTSLVGGFVGCLAAAFIMPGTIWKRVSVGIVSLVVFVVTFSFGSQSFVRAFGECVEKGEEVRIALKDYYGKENRYPEHLGELKRPIPCDRLTRSTILEYERNKTGYVLSFRDWLVEVTATESNAFIAHK